MLQTGDYDQTKTHFPQISVHMDFLLNSAEHHWSTLMTLVCSLTSNSPSYMRSVVLTCFYFSLGWSLLSTGAPRYIKVH